MDLKKLERYLRVNLLGLGPRLIKKEFLGRGLTKIEKLYSSRYVSTNKCSSIVGCSCYIFSSIVIRTPNGNFRIVPILNSVSNISVDNMYVMHSVFLTVLSDVFIVVP